MEKNDNINGRNPFKVPDGYFEEVNRNIMCITTGKKVEAKKQGLYLRLRSYIAIAASVAVLAIMTYTGTKLFSPHDETLSLSTITTGLYPEYLLNGIDILTIEEEAILMELPLTEPEIGKKDIIDYLLLENIDINELQEQL